MDYCPLCHHSNCLLDNPKGTHEGEITCGVCDADYDGTTGYDKNGGGSRGQLIQYEEEEVSVTQKVPLNPQPEPIMVVQKTPLEQMRDVYNNNKII